MDTKELYGKWLPTNELVGVFIMISNRLKGKRIKQQLDEKIKKSKEKALQIELTEKKKDELLIQYQDLNNFFSHHFKKIDDSRSFSLDEKVDYCLEQYKKESKKLLSAANLIILQENFLNGAEQTLFLYSALNGKVSRGISIQDIIGVEKSRILINFLKDKNFIDQNNNLIVDNKSRFIRIHRFLKDIKVINSDFNDKTILDAMEREYNASFDQGTFSKAIGVKMTESEEAIYKELEELIK